MSKRARRQSANRYFRSLESLETRRFLAAHIVGSTTSYATIQAAVDAAATGATITVDAGTYSENVVIAKTLTLRGAEAGVDGRSNTRVGSPETILNGHLNSDNSRSASFTIAANNVTIDGFTVQGNTSQGDTGAGIVISPSKFGTHILNNIVQNNVSGLFLANGSTITPAVIQYNLFRNNNNAGSNGGRGIYTDGGISGGNIADVVIDSNAFINNRGGSGTTGLEAAIAFEAQATNAQSNITITNNAFDANGKATLFFNTSGIVIRNNAITNTLDQYSGTLRFEGNNHDATIQYNTVYDNTGPAVAVDSKGVAGDNSNFVVTYNNFYFNSLGYGSRIGVAFDGSVYDGSPDVRNNWWGSSTGPGGDGSGSGDKVYGIGHVVPGGQWYVQTGGSELYSPWLTAPYGTSRAPYFGLASSDGASFQAEDFDHGGEGVAYHDTTSGNSAGKYRTREQVDIESTSDSGGGYDVTAAKAGEWLGYTVNLGASGTYTIDLRVANSSTGGTFHLLTDGVNVTGTMSVPSTGGLQTWQTISKTGIALAGGTHDVRLVLDTNAGSGAVGNFNWIRFTNTGTSTLPTAPSNLSAVALSPTSVSLTWQDNSTNETGFAIERMIAGGSWTSLTTVGNVTSYTDPTATAAASYSYRVRAIASGGGTSAASNTATVTTPDVQTIKYLSDLTWVSATNGWGPVERDMSVGGSNAGDGDTLTLNGVSYAKGLGANAISDVIYNLGGAYKTFLSDVGVDDHQTVNGTVAFQVFADGVKIYDSGVMTPTSATQSLNLNIAGVQQLRLHVDDAGDGGDYDWADWAGARVDPGSTQTVQPPATPINLSATAMSATRIDLLWADVTGETLYKIERSTDGTNFTQIATTGADVAKFSDTTVAASTKYYYRVRAGNSAGDSAPSAIVNATTPAATTTALPAGWSQTSIGTTTAGSASYSSGVYTVSGSGSDIGGTSDSFGFAYRQISGDFTIIARVTGEQNTDPLAKAGIMVRSSLAANSKEIGLFATPSSGLQMLSRTATGGRTSTTSLAGPIAPYWLKLVRSGSRVSAYSSANGSTWTLIGQIKISLGTSVYVGFAVTSHKDGTLNTATFDNVTIA